MSVVEDLSKSVMTTLIKELDFKEDNTLSKGLTELHSAMSPDPVGGVKVLRNPLFSKLVYISLKIPMIKLDSHMLFCFTDKASLVPHFTLDAVQAQDHYAFHLDLIPKLDLAANYSYLKKVYEPLTKTFQEAQKISELSAAKLSPSQIAAMSPWMLAHRATLDAMDHVGLVVNKYLSYWLSLDKNELSNIEDLTNSETEQRDAKHRRFLFNPEVDPVWAKIAQLLGAEKQEELRSILITP